MALTQFTTDISYIAALPDSPTPNGGFSKAQLKAEFDKAGNALKAFINETMITEIEAELALKSSSSEHYNKNDLNSTVEGSSGADKIGVTSIDGLSGTTTQTVLESVGVSLAHIIYNIDNENLSSDIENLQSALNKGILNLLVPRDITISTLTLSNRYQKITFKGDITITGSGIILNAPDITINVNKIKGSTTTISGGELSPIPTLECAFDVRSAFANISFNLIEGFNQGLLYRDGNNGTENNFTGLIQKCNTAVRLINTSGSAKHEGNTFALRIFQCYKGYDIDVNCKYQNISKVVDNAEINNSLDIDERSGNNIIIPYFVRVANCNLSNNNILLNVNGSGYLQVGNKNLGTVIGSSNIELTGSTPFIDAKFTADKDYDYRVLFGSGSIDFKTDTDTVLSLLDDGYIALPKYINGTFAPNFTGMNLPSEVLQNKIVLAKNSGDNNKTRLYIYSNGWKFIEMPERTISSGNAAPTSGTWNIGDRVNNNNPTYAKNISHWTCVAGGTAGGTWTAHGCGGGTTANRPTLTLNDLGYLYYDTDLNKLIRWSGGAWQIPT